MHTARLLYIFFVFVFSIALYSGASYAQSHSGYCDDAESTADFQTCINAHNETSKKKLNKIYKELVGQSGKDSNQDIVKAQKEWLEYRDTQCAYEAAITENEALKHVYELSCLSVLTDMRTDYLSKLKNRENKEIPHEFSTQPRWVNILTNSYPGVYWRYGEWMSADLDCDGEKEDIMTGLDVKPQKLKAGEADIKGKHSTLVIAVADTPKTGKPKTSLYRVPVIPAMADPDEDNEDTKKTGKNVKKDMVGIHLCDANVDMALISHVAVQKPATDNKPADNATDQNTDNAAADNTPQAPQRCGTALQINDSICKPLQLYKTATDYKLEFFSPSAGDETLFLEQLETQATDTE